MFSALKHKVTTWITGYQTNQTPTETEPMAKKKTASRLPPSHPDNFKDGEVPPGSSRPKEKPRAKAKAKKEPKSE